MTLWPSTDRALNVRTLPVPTLIDMHHIRLYLDGLLVNTPELMILSRNNELLMTHGHIILTRRRRDCSNSACLCIFHTQTGESIMAPNPSWADDEPNTACHDRVRVPCYRRPNARRRYDAASSDAIRRWSRACSILLPTRHTTVSVLTIAHRALFSQRSCSRPAELVSLSHRSARTHR